MNNPIISIYIKTESLFERSFVVVQAATLGILDQKNSKSKELLGLDYLNTNSFICYPVVHIKLKDNICEDIDYVEFAGAHGGHINLVIDYDRFIGFKNLQQFQEHINTRVELQAQGKTPKIRLGSVINLNALQYRNNEVTWTLVQDKNGLIGLVSNDYVYDDHYILTLSLEKYAKVLKQKNPALIVVKY